METTQHTEERPIFCSGCLQVAPESHVHVIPYYNSDVGKYVTTYRCDRCWLPALGETRARLESTEDEIEIASAAAFFEEHGVFIHEFRRGDAIAVVREILLRMIDMLRAGVIRPAIGPIAPGG